MPQTVPASVVLDSPNHLEWLILDFVLSLLVGLRGYAVDRELGSTTVTMDGIQHQMTIAEMVVNQHGPLKVVLQWQTGDERCFVLVEQTPDADWVERQEYHRFAIQEEGAEGRLQLLDWAPSQWQLNETSGTSSSS